ncbi:MAG: BtaA family protein [Phycisphaerae bacterium]|nr:BtaA family protein [Phycisphaerae bacterium]
MITVIDLPQAKRRPLLERLVFRGIVFNMSWEDPEMDRRAFQLTGDDTVLSITSAGCNPLNFLCQSPRRLICVDGNPAQNAILELKLAGLATLDHATFFDIFAARSPERVESLYPNKLRPLISPRSQKFWDKNLKVVARGLYRHGRMGVFCRILRRYLKLVKINDSIIERLFACDSLEEQQSLYDGCIAPRLWRRSSKMFVSFKPLMYLAGVHPKQFELVDGRHNMYDYIRERIEHALTKVPAKDNYFLSQAISGRFRGNHVPPYLLEENFETLRNNLDRVEIVNGWLEPYLNSQPAGSINKFNLLDIFDWMPATAFESTLQAVLRASAPDATLIYRSGSYRLDPPESVRPFVHHHQELSRELLAIDRSATYGSFYVLSVKNGVAA